LTSFEGELLGSIAIKRRIQERLSTLYKLKNYQKDPRPLYISSGISQGIVDDFNDIREISEKIALKLNSRGPINIQCRKSENKKNVFEINPRFSGTESLTALRARHMLCPRRGAKKQERAPPPPPELG
jgi:hypothetical protein